jgi:hypothetical protein
LDLLTCLRRPSVRLLPRRQCRGEAIRSESEPNVAMQQKCDKAKPEFWAAMVNVLN